MRWTETEWTIDSLGDLFCGDHLRVQLRLTPQHTKVALEVRAAPVEQLATDSFPPWYWSGNQRVKFDDSMAQPKSFSWIASYPSAQIPKVSSPPSGLVAPCLILPKGHALLLDGNHRFLSMLLNRPQATVIQVGIPGVTNPEVLPDLQHLRG